VCVAVFGFGAIVLAHHYPDSNLRVCLFVCVPEKERETETDCV